MTFDVKRARKLASTLATTGPHSYYPTDAECVEAGELLEAACDRIAELQGDIDGLRSMLAEACDLGGETLRSNNQDLTLKGRRQAKRLREIRQSASGEGK